MDRAGLTLQGVSKRFSEDTVVDDVSLVVPAGTLLTLLGPSGCGKTTILRMIGGFILPSSGTIDLGGTDITVLPPERRPTAMVFQGYALFPHLRLRENIGFGLRMRGVARNIIAAKVDEALDLVQLGHLANPYPHQMSGGQQQRAALARALVIEPQLLLLDEPFGALDRALREEMQVELRKIQQALGMTMIFVTHDQEEAFILSDRIAVMHSGRLEQIGEPGDIYDKPHTRFVAAFMGASNFLRGKISHVDDTSCTVTLDEGTFINARISGRAVGDAVELAFRPDGAEIGNDYIGECAGILRGKIVFISNLGGKLVFEIALPSGRTIKVQHDRSESDLYSLGNHVTIRLKPKACIVLDPT